MSITALQLVNRVRRMRRQGDTQAIAEHSDLACLDALNRAVSYVMTTKDWTFNHRRSQLALKARRSGVTVSVDAGSSTGVVESPGLTSDDVYNGEIITRVLAPSSAVYGDTAFRVLTSIALTNDAAVEFAVPIPDAIAETAGELFYSEYILPETVRGIISVRHQNQTLSLEQIGSTIEFEDIVPRQQIRYGEPEVVSIGGFDVPTHQSANTPPEPGLRLVVWPVPDDEYVLDYTYQYRHPEMTEATSELVGVPDEVVDQIVNFATAEMQTHYDRREEGRALMRDADAMTEQVYRMHGGSNYDRATIGNWEGSRGRVWPHYSFLNGRRIGN